MKSILLLPAALIAFQAQASAPLKLPITQENHKSWMRSYTNMKAGEKAIAILTCDVIQSDKIVAPKGSRIFGMVAKDSSGVTFNNLVLPEGTQVAIEPFTLKGMLKEGE